MPRFFILSLIAVSLSGCIAYTVADTAVSVAATAVETTADIVGAGVDAASVGEGKAGSADGWASADDGVAIRTRAKNGASRGMEPPGEGSGAFWARRPWRASRPAAARRAVS